MWERDVQRISPFSYTALHVAKTAAIAELLIKHGADVHAQDKILRTPLHFASFRRAEEIAKALIAHGANVKAKSAKGITPLHYAVSDFTPSIKLIKLLLAHGADVNAQTTDGKSQTPLDYARKHLVKKYLQKHGAKYGKDL